MYVVPFEFPIRELIRIELYVSLSLFHSYRLVILVWYRMKTTFQVGLYLILFSTVLALYPSSSDVIDLTESNFDRLVRNSQDVWIVEFFAPWCGHCQQLVPEYTKAASALKGVVKVGAVNADEEKSLASKFGVRGFPTIKIFRPGGEKNGEEFRGSRSAQALTEAALTALKERVIEKLGGKKSGSGGGSKKDVIELTDSNFNSLVLDSEEMWLVEFYAPWCGHCKNLEPHWAEAATKLKGKVKVGALDATAHSSKAAEYNVQGYPTIKFFGPGKKSRSSAEDYNGGRTSEDIVNFALEKLTQNLPPPEIKQIISEETLKAACEEQPLCVISVLPHILDCQSECRNKYLLLLKEMGERFKQKMWGWVWAEAGAQPELESALEMGGFGYPAMAVLSAKKLKYSILRGPFSADGISEFLRNLSYGRGRTAPVQGTSALPTVVPSEPWDGKDGTLPSDEDIDLSDIDLEEGGENGAASKDEL